jgi:hypothetical protein
MAKIILFFFFIPLFSYSQNIVTHISISKVEESVNPEDISDYELYTIKISPGYQDRNFTIKLIKIDRVDNETILSQPEINVELIIHKKNYKMSDGKFEWDYETEVKSNDTWTDEYIEIGNCSNQKHLTCLIRVKKSEKYKVKVFVGEKEYYREFEIRNGDAKGM